MHVACVVFRPRRTACPQMSNTCLFLYTNCQPLTCIPNVLFVDSCTDECSIQVAQYVARKKSQISKSIFFSKSNNPNSLCNHRNTNLTLIFFRNESTGATWDGEQELRPHPSAINGDDDGEAGYFERLGAKTETALEKFFTIWGTTCAKHPWIVLLFGMHPFPLN